MTHDIDGVVLAAGGIDHAGIAWSDATQYRNLVGPLVQTLLLTHGVRERDDRSNRIE